MSYLTYTEFTPSPPLRAFVECFWTGRSGKGMAEPAFNRVLPDGCMDIIFDFEEPSCYVVGTMRSASEVRMSGKVDLLGVRFRPTALPGLLRTPASELTDRVVPLSEFWPSSEELSERMFSCCATTERLLILEEAFEEQRSAWSRIPAAAAKASELIHASGGRTTVDVLTQSVSISSRHLERLFNDLIGVSPKEACRIARFRRAVGMLHTELPLAPLAFECGYFDQAHLTREFKRLAGIPPSVYRQKL